MASCSRVRCRWAGVVGVTTLLVAAVVSTSPAQAAASTPTYQPGLRTAAPPRSAASVQAGATAGPTGYIPCDVADAYGLYPLGLAGSGVTVAIVVASDEANLANDLLAFDSTFQLPDPDLKVSAPFGHTGPPRTGGRPGPAGPRARPTSLATSPRPWSAAARWNEESSPLPIAAASS